MRTSKHINHEEVSMNWEVHVGGGKFFKGPESGGRGLENGRDEY
jgi:hypothetical protein